LRANNGEERQTCAVKYQHDIAELVQAITAGKTDKYN
jgi:hypothetical protein